MSTTSGIPFQLPILQNLEDISSHEFGEPTKQINEGKDVDSFLHSKAYRDILTFLFQLNRAMFPSLISSQDQEKPQVKSWEIQSSSLSYSKTISSLRTLLDELRQITREHPPDPGPRRFGNMAFRKWYSTLESRTPALLSTHLPDLPSTAHVELSSYFLGSFGSAQRLDYGSGHELSFLAFLGCIWKLNGFPLSPPTSPSSSSQPPPSPSTPTTTTTPSTDPLSHQSRSIVLGVIQPYLTLIRTLIKTYTLEPAGSHGVWGLDDHSFLPYIFGSAQYGPAIPPVNNLQQPPTPTPTEGSLPTAPMPGDITSAPQTLTHAPKNMYFSAIHFIHEVKRGPFWEHSPMLYDISGVSAGWGKINKGMLKMYDAEVLGKFPVVQHFRFGSFFEWVRDEDARMEVGGAGSAAAAAGRTPRREGVVEEGGGKVAGERGGGVVGTQAPWAAADKGRIREVRGIGEGTKAPWGVRGSRTVARGGGRIPIPLRSATGQESSNRPAPVDIARPEGSMPPPTRAPWARPP